MKGTSIAWFAATVVVFVVLSLSTTLWSMPTTPLTNPSRGRAKRTIASAPSQGACPVRYSTNHGIQSTGRKALVMYTFTSHADLLERQVEVDNFLFFRAHGILPPDTPTALFSSVDYVITTSNMSRNTTAGVHGVVQCARNANVRVFEAPSAPCDLCGYGRGIKALGGAEAVAKHYEYVFMFNSGVRGPFFTEAPAGPDDAPSVTWLDHYALGGEHVYTGAIMAGTVGMATHRPYLLSFAFGFPTSLLIAMHPVLYAGCVETPPLFPGLWETYLASFDADLHTDVNTKELIAKLKKILDNPSVLKSTPKGDRENEVARKIDDKVAAGVESHRAQVKKIYTALVKGRNTPPWSDRKMACVYRTEVQMLKTALTSKLPPESGDWTSQSSLRRPRLTSHQKSLLSPVLSGYLHEGHYFGRSLFHNQTIVNMGHGLLLREPANLGTCGSVLVKYGGVIWREKKIHGVVARDIQLLTLAQAPRHIAPSHINIAQVLECPTRTTVEPLG